MMMNSGGFGATGSASPSVGTGVSSPNQMGPAAVGTPGAGMMAPSGPATSAPAAAAGITASGSPDSPTSFQDVALHWAILQRFDSQPEVTTMPDEETARRRYNEFNESARKQAPTEPHRWPKLLSGRITWTEVP